MNDTILFEYPHTGTVTNSVEIRHPEFGDSVRAGRHQFSKQLRNGVTVAYDRGLDLNEEYVWDFQSIKDEDRTALLAFFNTVQWGARKIKVTDWYGVTKIIRLTTTSLLSQNARVELLNGTQENVLWDFKITFVDMSNNVNELGVNDEGVVTSALALHILDQDHPHNKLAEVTVNAADGAVVLDSVDLIDHHSAVFLITAENGTKRGVAIAVGTTDRDYVTPADATAVKDSADIEWHQNTAEEVSNEVTLALTISGTGDTQKLNVTADVTVDGWKFRARRFKV